MTNKKVGVVIPIYNVEKYLRECLESVVNQSYKNLEILLVNDGSTDENSFKIAKEYTLKDKRITLFDKENGESSSARNTGIEYLSGDYELKFEKEENDFFIFKITNENPLKIHNVYKNRAYFENQEKELEIPRVDYIIFLDSDDYWELDCVEECVKRMQGVDVLWFDEIKYFEGIKNKKQSPSRLKNMGFVDEEGVISPLVWIIKHLKSEEKSFSFVCFGMIDFNFLKRIKLKFPNKHFAEDHLFGILLFAQTSSIYVFPKEFYHYRIRPDSKSNHDKKGKEVPPYLRDIYKKFDENILLTKEYFKASSWVLTTLDLIGFLQKYHDRQLCFLIEKSLLPYYIKQAFKIKSFPKDPLSIKPKLEILKTFKHSKLVHKIQRMLLRLKYKNTKLQEQFLDSKDM